MQWLNTNQHAMCILLEAGAKTKINNNRKPNQKVIGEA